MTKIWLVVLLVLSNVTIEPSNMRKKSPNVTKVRSHVMLVLLNMTMKPANVSRKYETTKCDKSTVICNICTI